MVKRQLQQFICVAKNRNISKAAKELYMAQQTLSQSINALEQEFGVPLFIRTRHGVTLTEFGRKILFRAELLLNQIEQFEQFVNSEATTYFQMSTICIDELCLASAFSGDIMYLAAQSNITLETGFGGDNGLFFSENDSCNVCFCFRPEKLGKYSYLPIVKEHPVVVVSKEHPLAAKNEVCVEDILTEGLVLPRFNHSSFINQLLRAYEGYNVYPVYAYEGTEIRTLLDMVRANIGIKISPTYILHVFPMDGLKVLRLLSDDLFIEYGFLIKDPEKLTPTETHFIQAMLDEHNTPWQIIKE